MILVGWNVQYCRGRDLKFYSSWSIIMVNVIPPLTLSMHLYLGQYKNRVRGGGKFISVFE